MHLGHKLQTDQNVFDSRFETRCVGTYFSNSLGFDAKARRRASGQGFLAWIQDFGSKIGITSTLSADIAARGPRLTPEDKSRLLLAVEGAARSQRSPAFSSLERRLRWITETLRLSYEDAMILKLCVRAALFEPVHELASALSDDFEGVDELSFSVASTMLGRKRSAIADRLRPYQPLRQLGLVEDRGREDFAPSKIVMRLACSRHNDPERLGRELFGSSEPSLLAWEDFDHLGELRDTVLRLLETAMQRRMQGIGILLHGIPGTGKTEFAKVLAARLSAKPVFIGETDECEGEPSRTERVAHYAFTSVLAGRAGRTLLVVDEADDIFTGVDEDDRASRTGSKVFMNRLVERCAAPTIWITNSPERIGDAVVRRMTLALRFREPNRIVRRRIAERLAQKFLPSLSRDEIEKLAAVEAAPALIEAGLRGAALAGGGIDIALKTTGSLIEAMASAPRVPSRAETFEFDPSLSAADCDLTMLAERAREAYGRGETALSFCLHGLSGTGKSAYARFVAARLGIEVIEKRASDLMSMFVGGTEKRSARAFADAADRRAMLILDEADSLLWDRSGAVRSWEVSVVNEMLTWMERHPQPLVCTTNLVATFDAATVRRFLFKVEFKQMRAPQAREAFQRAFGLEPPSSLDHIDLLTPGDFDVVVRKARVLGKRDAETIVAMLGEEVAAKPGAGRNRMGFLGEGACENEAEPAWPASL